MKHLSKIILFTTLMISNLAFAVELPNYPRNTTTLDRQKSPKNFGRILDAYISYKYVGGYVMIVTFDVPNLSYNKEFYFLKDASSNKSVKSVFSKGKSSFLRGQGNTLWLGNSKGRSRFVMRINGIFNPRGPYTIYAKFSGKNVPIYYTLKDVPKKLKP